MKYLVFVTILCFSLQAFSQTKFKHKVYIKAKGCPPTTIERQIEKEKGGYKIFEICEEEIHETLVLPAGFELTEIMEKGYNGIQYELRKESLLKHDSTITYSSKMIKAKRFCEEGRYKANLSISHDTILINFWLEVVNGKTYYQATETERDSFPFNPETKYFMRLNNRQYESFLYSNFEIAALVIPFKYYFGRVEEETDIIIDPVFNTEININTFSGIRLGKVSYAYDPYKGMIENEWSLTFGVFIGLNSQKLDSISTSASSQPLVHEINVPSLSYGFGSVFNIRNFNLGIFAGKDYALGENGGKWNFHKKWWLGFGFGYKIAFLGRQE